MLDKVERGDLLVPGEVRVQRVLRQSLNTALVTSSDRPLIRIQDSALHAELPLDGFHKIAAAAADIGN